MTNDRPDEQGPEGNEAEGETNRSNLIGWGLFALIAMGILLARILGGGGC